MSRRYAERKNQNVRRFTENVIPFHGTFLYLNRGRATEAVTLIQNKDDCYCKGFDILTRSVDVLGSCENLVSTPRPKRIILETCDKTELQISLVVRKPVSGISDLVRHKPGCTATEDG